MEKDIDSRSKLFLLYKHIQQEISVELYVHLNISKHLNSFLTHLRSTLYPQKIKMVDTMM